MSFRPDTSAAIGRRFDDVDDLAMAVRDWDLDFIQLDRGPFRGETLQFGAGDALLSEARFDRTLRQEGSAPRFARTFVVPAAPDVRFRWRRQEVTADDLLLFPASGELHAISQLDFHVFTISLSESLLERAASDVDLVGLPRLLGQERTTVSDSRMAPIRRGLKRLSQAARHDMPSSARSASLDALRFEIPCLLLRALAAAGQPAQRPPSRRRDLAVRRAERFIARNGDRLITVGELCHFVGVSERTLQYAFLEQLGTTPKAYLQAVRLAAVRRDLKQADPARETIARIASRRGYWHQGQFAADYRNQYGELPSQTLAQET